MPFGALWLRTTIVIVHWSGELDYFVIACFSDVFIFLAWDEDRWRLFVWVCLDWRYSGVSYVCMVLAWLKSLVEICEDSLPWTKKRTASDGTPRDLTRVRPRRKSRTKNPSFCDFGGLRGMARDLSRALSRACHSLQTLGIAATYMLTPHYPLLIFN